MEISEDTRNLLARAIVGQRVDLSAVPGDHLFMEAAKHGVLPLLATALQSTQRGDVSDDFRALLHEQSRRYAAMDLLQRHATARFMRQLQQAGHDVLVIKGTALAYTIYEQPWQRPRTDVDVWIREAESQDVAHLLAAEGYQLHNLDHNTVSSRQFQANRQSGQDALARFDVHLRISNRALFQRVLDFDDSLSRAVSVPSLAAKTPDLADRFLHGALHRVAQGRNTEGHRLIWLFDLHRIFSIMTVADQAELARRALDRRLGCLCAEALRLCRELFGTEIDDPGLALLENQRAREPSARLLRSGRWAWAWSDMRGQERWSDRVRLVRELIGNRLAV